MYVSLVFIFSIMQYAREGWDFFVKDTPQLILSLLKTLMLLSKSAESIFSQSSDRNFFLDGSRCSSQQAPGSYML